MNTTPERPFSSPQEEIQWLRGQLESKTSPEQNEPTLSKEAAKEILHEVVEKASQPSESYALPDSDIKKKAESMEQEEHHEQIDELMAIAQEKGIISALKVARSIGNPHILDDFHDHLIEILLFQDDSQSSSS